ncbi:40S ribosomal protein s2-2 [Phtheirospermum japonicum]|uniref:40S ribosomal protein s2-2 n=1 Tax=Phtheirospermum japonicum TaxID=374723 RepID=A0A830B5T1_9LAMI|nr:40S ribosomal protein s2-2 [Phtheirospermum japonicum]
MWVCYVRIFPSPRGAGIVVARVPKKVLQIVGIEDVFTPIVDLPSLLGTLLRSEYFSCLHLIFLFLSISYLWIIA